MPDVLDHQPELDRHDDGVIGPLPTTPAPVLPPAVEVDERAARPALLDQIARLESELSDLFTTTFPREGFESRGRRPRDRAARRPLMGRRSRKRSLSGAGPPRPAAGDDESTRAVTSRAERDAERRRLRASGEARAPAARRGSRRRTGERPQAPWGTFPLTELVILVAIVLGIAGLV